jgi:hypothetical protein
MLLNYRRSTVSKKIKLNVDELIIVWAAISYDEPEEVYFLEEKENSIVY